MSKLLVAAIIILAAAILSLIVIFLVLSQSSTYIELPEDWDNNLSYYPLYFIEEGEFNGIVVVDDDAPQSDIDAANDVVAGLRKAVQKGEHSITLTTYTEIRGLYSQNAIFIGTCDLNPRNRFVNLFADCLSLPNGHAIIKVYSNNDSGVTIVHIIGKSLDDTLRAGKVLKDYDKYELRSNQVFVKGQLDRIYVEISKFGELKINR